MDTRYLAFEDNVVDFAVECVETFANGDEGSLALYGELVMKGILSLLSDERELTYPPNVDGLVLSDDFHHNEVACDLLRMCVLVRVVEACRESEPTRDGRPFDPAQAKWILMRIYNAFPDLYQLGKRVPEDLRRSITVARLKTAPTRVRVDR